MPKLDLEEIRRLAATRSDTIDPDVVSRLQPGAVFEIDDKLVRFPNEANRTWHDFRRVIVVQAPAFLGPGLPDTVSVVPCSASRAAPGRGNFLIPEQEKAFSKPNVVALATLLMPVLKKSLTAEGHRGDLTDETYGRLCAHIAMNLGIRAPAIAPLKP